MFRYTKAPSTLSRLLAYAYLYSRFAHWNLLVSGPCIFPAANKTSFIDSNGTHYLSHVAKFDPLTPILEQVRIFATLIHNEKNAKTLSWECVKLFSLTLNS